MKPYVLIFKQPEECGSFLFTQEELKKMIERVYDDAYNEGYKAGIGQWTQPITYTTPFSPQYTTTTPNNIPNPYQVTCSEAANAVGD